jgi:hypothetical protein
VEEAAMMIEKTNPQATFLVAEVVEGLIVDVAFILLMLALVI